MPQVGLNFSNQFYRPQQYIAGGGQQSLYSGYQTPVSPYNNGVQPSLAGSFPVQSQGALGIIQQLMQVIQSLFSIFTGNLPTGGTGTGSTDGSNGTETGSGTTGGAGGTGTVAPGSAPDLAQNDILNYVLGQTRGGTAFVDENILGSFMQQNSRLANAGANEFDAVIADAYSSQFKGYALGLDVAFNPGQDNVNTVANNILAGQNAQFTPEAELLSKVAAVYRGEFGGVGRYDNAALQNLLVQWGREDIANQPGVGVPTGDVQSIGGVVKALTEQQDPAIRQAWLQDIFDFQNGTGVSPSGAVPQTQEYQFAIDMVQSGAYDQLLTNYANGVRTNGPITIPNTANGGTGGTGNTGYPDGYGYGTNPNPGTDPTPNPNPSPNPDPGPNPSPDPNVGELVNGEINDPAINRNLNFRNLNSDQRSDLGLSDRDRAVLHLWGRQMNERGHQNGDVYLNGGFTPAERPLVAELRAREMEQFGEINGSLLDEEFFALNDRLHNLTPGTTSAKYANRQLHSSSGIPITLRNDLAANEAEGGLTAFEQATLRLWGHEPLFNGGTIDGSILGYTIGNQNALDSNANSGGNGVDNQARVLLEADFLTDGTRNGDSLRSAFNDVMDKIYGIDAAV